MNAEPRKTARNVIIACVSLIAGPGGAPAQAMPQPEPPAWARTFADQVVRIVAQGDPLQDFVGRWRFPGDQSCASRFGIVTVNGNIIRFEWLYGDRRVNLAEERIERVEGNVVYTFVLSDTGTTQSERGTHVQYTVLPDRWISVNLDLHERSVHLRC